MWRIVSGSLALVVAGVSGVVWYVLLCRRYRHATKFDYGLMSEMEELQLPIADSAFYMSYFYDVIRAPSVFEGIRRLLTDPRSEAPDTINAVHKFNVGPEIGVAVLHHILQMLSISISPFTLYVRSVYAWCGLGVAAMAMTAWTIGGGLLTGAAATSLFFSLSYASSMSTGARIFGQHSMALREFWGVPSLLCQNACLAAWLVRTDLKLLLVGYIVGTAVFEVCWQFAPFVLFLQMFSILGAHLLAGLPRAKVGQVATAAVLGTLAGLVASFGNRMLLCSWFFALAVSMAVVGFLPLPARLLPTGSVLEAVLVLALAVGCGAPLQQLIVRSASEQEDSHVIQLLLQKLGLAPENSSFDAFLYLQASEFGFISKQHIDEALQSGALPCAGISTALALVLWSRQHLCRRRAVATDAAVGSSKKAKGKKELEPKKAGKHTKANMPAPDAPLSDWNALPALVSQISFLCALLALAALVNRLRVIAAPVLCLVAALVASPMLWSSFCPRVVAWLLAHAAGVCLIVIPPYMTGALERWVTVGESQIDPDMLELVEWANSSLPSGALFMADMTMAAKFRLINPNVRVGNHPQYESLTSRQRNKAYYRTFTCAPPERVHAVLSGYSVTHILLNANACRARIGKLDAFHEVEDRCGSLGMAELQAKSFCHGGFLTGGPSYFRMVFRNAIYTVLELQERSSTGDSRASSYRGSNINSVDVWKPWLLGVEGHREARALARAATKWPRFYGGSPVSEEFLARAEALHDRDAIIVLQRAMRTEQSHGAAAAEGLYEQAFQIALDASTTDPAALFEVFEARKQVLMQTGQAALPALKKATKALEKYLVSNARSFELCDLAGWLSDWGQKKTGLRFWNHAKNRSLYDQCVREDWGRWEEDPLPAPWRAFLAI